MTNQTVDMKGISIIFSNLSISLPPDLRSLLRSWDFKYFHVEEVTDPTEGIRKYVTNNYRLPEPRATELIVKSLALDSVLSVMTQNDTSGKEYYVVTGGTILKKDDSGVVTKLKTFDYQ